jgi:hypothetical protein
MKTFEDLATFRSADAQTLRLQRRAETWDPSARSSNANLSPDKLTLSDSTNPSTAVARSRSSYQNELVYFEFSVPRDPDVTLEDVGIGFGDSAAPLDENFEYLGKTDASWGFYPGLGTAWHAWDNGANPNGRILTGVTVATGTGTGGLAINGVTGKAWALNEASSNADVEAGINPTFTFAPGLEFYLMACVANNFAVDEAAITANFGATPFKRSVPTGFSAANV